MVYGSWLLLHVAVPGFKDLGRSVTLTFNCRKSFHLPLSPHCPKMNKTYFEKLKEIQDFGPRDIKSYHLATARGRQTMVTK